MEKKKSTREFLSTGQHRTNISPGFAKKFDSRSFFSASTPKDQLLSMRVDFSACHTNVKDAVGVENRYARQRVGDNDTRYFSLCSVFLRRMVRPEQPDAETVGMGWICLQKRLAVITSYSSYSFRKSNSTTFWLFLRGSRKKKFRSSSDLFTFYVRSLNHKTIRAKSFTGLSVPFHHLRL